MAVLLLMVATPVRAETVAARLARWQPDIAEASMRFGIPEPWIRRVITAESGGRTHLGGAPIRSRVGAIGLMQLMPATWAALRIEHGLGDDPDNPRANILGGTAYLRAMYDRFGYPGCFAAYNAGPGRYAAYLAGRSRLPGETIAYLGAVTGRAAPAFRADAETTDMPPKSLLFAVRRALDSGAANPPARPMADRLFAVRREP